VLLEFPEVLDPPVLVEPVEELDEGDPEEEEELGGDDVEGPGGGARKYSDLATSAVWL